MTFVVQFSLPGGSRGLMIFTAPDTLAALNYREDMLLNHGHIEVSEPHPFHGSPNLPELYAIAQWIDETSMRLKIWPFSGNFVRRRPRARRTSLVQRCIASLV